ncbi:uncharacterized protein FOMMEDRAFT_57680, partial [Fomitiporia mediterranea MF3/22]|uniref:uncharacterized protein n=1 Tax=Fomitiporia mediterranea (strain MF3/22) TaxID=694068 RepID=UPI000440773A
VGTEQRLKRSDEDYIKQSENASILFRHECCLKKNKAEAARDPVTQCQCQADLSKTISNR